jgi:predicted O-methyltransferase YrrM
MNKLNKFFRGLIALLNKPSLINLILDNDDLNQEIVVNKYNLPKGFPEVAYQNFVKSEINKVSPMAFVEGSSTVLDLLLLKNLSVDKDYFEIGTWRGESAANVADVAKTCTTLNLSDEEMLSMNLPKEYIDLHFVFSKNNPKIKHLRGNSRTFDFSPYHNKMDVIFVDGDHHYDGVKNDTEIAFKLLKNQNSIIVWHDYGKGPNDIRWDVLRGIYEGTPIDKRKNLYRVQNTLCAIFYPHSIDAFDANPFAEIKNVFEFIVEQKSFQK